MNRLWLRLTLAFIIVTQLSMVVVAVLASWRISGEFRRYVVQRDVTILKDAQQTQLFLSPTTQSASPKDVQHTQLFLSLTTRSAPGPIPLPAPLAMPPLSGFMLANASGNVIYDPSGQRVNEKLVFTDWEKAVPVNGPPGSDQIIGYAIPVQLDMLIKSPEQGFLAQLNKILIIAALVVSGLATLIGLVISRMLVAPLASLTQAARAFAAHDWDYHVQAKGPREIAALANAFNEMAGEINRAETLRRNLMADIAHELRTPLAVMQCNLRSLLDGMIVLSQAEIATIYDETRLLNRLVDDLRELALADAGKLNLNMAQVHLADVLNTVANGFTVVADNVQISLHVRSTLIPIQADVDRLTQVMRNLIVNALRHTTSGTIYISAEAAAQQVMVSVTDTGEGIPPQNLPYVFERFYRGDPSRARANGGTGLGLAITKALVEAMGGTIGVESTPGKGSRFWFTLPADLKLTGSST